MKKSLKSLKGRAEPVERGQSDETEIRDSPLDGVELVTGSAATRHRA